MSGPGQRTRKHLISSRLSAAPLLLVMLAPVTACKQRAGEIPPELADAAHPNAPAPTSSASAAPIVLPRAPYLPVPPGTPVVSPTASGPEKVDFQDVAMGTNVHFIAYTNAKVNAEQIKTAISSAVAEMRRLEDLMSEWKSDSEVGKINLNPEQWVTVGPETFAVISRALAEGKASGGAFDITFQAMSDIWKFGSAADAQPKLPSPAEISARRKLVDYRTVELDAKASAVRIPKAHKIGLGGIAKGYIVDRAVAVMRKAGIECFLVQAGGDLYGAGKKPDGTAWISGSLADKVHVTREPTDGI